MQSLRQKAGPVLYIALNFMHYSALFSARPYVSLLASERQASMLVIGVITSLYSVSQSVLALPLGRYIDLKGSGLPLRFGAALFLLSALGLAYAPTIVLIALSAILMGISHVMILLSSQTVLAGLELGGKREFYIGMISFTGSAGHFVGPVLGGYMNSRFGTSLGFWGAAILGTLCLLIALVIPQQRPSGSRPAPLQTLGLIADRNILRTIMISAVVLFSTEVLVSYFPLYCNEIGLPTLLIGTIMSTYGIAQMMIRPFLRYLIKWFRRDRLLILSLLLGGLFLAAHGLFRVTWLLFLSAGMAGLTLGLATPMTLLAVSEVAPPEQRSQVLALRVMGNYLGQSISPLIFGAIGSLAGLAPVFWISGAVLAASARLAVPKLKTGRKERGDLT
jgi:MFS family permease